MTAQMAVPAAPEGGAETFFKLAFAIGVLVAGLEVGYLVTSPLPYDPVGYLIGRDFVNTWLGAQLALTGDPAPYFGIDAYWALLAEKFGPAYPLHIWSYPPHFLLFSWPLGFMPYMTAYIVYCVLGLILYVVVVNEGRRRIDHLLLLVLSPAVTLNIWTGQNGFVTTALLVGGLIMLDRRPILAGVLFGLLSIKPQLGVLLPLILALTGRWRTIAAAAVTIVALVVVASIAFGWKIWPAYWYDAMPTQSKVVLDGFSHYMVHMPTAFMNAKVAGLPLMAAIVIQAAVSVATIAAVAWTFRRRRDPDLSTALFVTAIFTVTPYAFNYDMVVFSWVMIKLMDRTDNDRWDYGLMLAVWAVPLLTVPMGISDILPISFLPILAFGARLVWRLWKLDRAEQGSKRGERPFALDLPFSQAPALDLAATAIRLEADARST
jgi:alpha-1,2-mannosyltransferase